MLRGITGTSIFVTITAVIFTALDITGAGDGWSAFAQVGDHDATIITAVAAVVLWLARWWLRRDQDKALLIRTLADAVPAQRKELARTLPFPELRVL